MDHAEPVEDDRTAERIADLLLWTARRIRAESEAELGPVGLTPAQSRALCIIEHSAGPIRMADLASTLQIVPRSATSLVDALAEAGLVVRQTDDADRRAVRVTVSPAGRRRLRRSTDCRRRAGEAVLGPLSESDRRTLLRLLTRLNADCGRSCR